MTVISQKSPSPANALRVAGESVSATPPSKSDHVKNLRSLQDTIEAASVHELHNPDSECRMAIDVLVQLAATPGEGGKDARTALGDIYVPIGPEKRYALLNAAHLCTQQKVFGDTPELHAAAHFMAACSPLPPLGNNGAGHIHERLAELARKVTLEFESNPKVLTNITQAELREASAGLENLNVRPAPVSMAASDAGRPSFAQVMKDVQEKDKTATVWVSDGDGYVAVVAERTADGKTRFHVLAPPGDELGYQARTALYDISPRECVIHEVEHPHLALKDVNDNFRGGVELGHQITASAAKQSSMPVEEQQAANLASRIPLIGSFEANGAHAPDGPSLPLPIEPAVVPPGPAGNLEHAQALFAVPTANKPQTTPAEFRVLASAAGFGKSWDGNPENVGFSGMTDVMETHSQVSVAAPDSYLSRVLDAKLTNMPQAASDLAKAMMEVNRVQAKLGKSSIWEQSYVGQQKSPLGRGGANLLVLPHQGPLVIREPLALAAKAATAVKAAGNGPTAAIARERAMAQFNRELANAKGYAESQLKRMDEGITMLKDIEESPKAGRTAKADAREMRGALEKLRSEWESGLPQQIVKFAAAAAVDPEQAVAALT